MDMGHEPKNVEPLWKCFQFASRTLGFTLGLIGGSVTLSFTWSSGLQAGGIYGSVADGVVRMPLQVAHLWQRKLGRVIPWVSGGKAEYENELGIRTPPKVSKNLTSSPHQGMFPVCPKMLTWNQQKIQRLTQEWSWFDRFDPFSPQNRSSPQWHASSFPPLEQSPEASHLSWPLLFNKVLPLPACFVQKRKAREWSLDSKSLLLKQTMQSMCKTQSKTSKTTRKTAS